MRHGNHCAALQRVMNPTDDILPRTLGSKTLSGCKAWPSPRSTCIAQQVPQHQPSPCRPLRGAEIFLSGVLSPAALSKQQPCG